MHHIKISLRIYLPFLFAAFLISLSLLGCAGITGNSAIQPTTSPKSTFIYVGQMAAASGIVTSTANTDALTSYEIQIHGSLKRLGAFDASTLPGGIVDYAASRPWVFTCDARPVCQEFRADTSGNLMVGADISSFGLHHVAAIDPSGNWLVASSMQGEQVFRIQADGTLLPGPHTLPPLPPPPIPPDFMDFSIVAFDPTGKFVLAVDPVFIVDMPGGFGFDSATGIFTRASVIFQLAEQGFHFMGFTPDGLHALGVQKTDTGSGDIEVLDWNPNNGSLNFHSKANLAINDVPDFFPSSLAMAGNLIFVQGGSTQNVVLHFDPSTGAISDTGERFPNESVNGTMRVDERTHTLVVTSPGNNLIGVWKYDPVTGTTSAVPGSPFPSGQTPEIIGMFSQ